MKIQNLLILGALGAAALMLFKKSGAAPAESAPFTMSSTTPQGVSVKEKITSVPQGVTALNDVVSSGGTLQRTSSTLVSPTRTSTGTSGGVAKLATGAVVSITTINKTGTTALDKQIASNQAASAAKTASGLTFKGYGADNKAIWK